MMTTARMMKMMSAACPNFANRYISSSYPNKIKTYNCTHRIHITKKQKGKAVFQNSQRFLYGNMYSTYSQVLPQYQNSSPHLTFFHYLFTLTKSPKSPKEQFFLRKRTVWNFALNSTLKKYSRIKAEKKLQNKFFFTHFYFFWH